MPGLELGKLYFAHGDVMAAVDNWEIELTGKGGHGSMPELSIDPVVAGSSLVMALQTIVSRNVSPHNSAVVTIGAFLSGNAGNVIAQSAILRLSIRTKTPADRGSCSARSERSRERRPRDMAARTRSARAYRARSSSTTKRRRSGRPRSRGPRSATRTSSTPAPRFWDRRTSRSCCRRRRARTASSATATRRWCITRSSSSIRASSRKVPRTGWP